MACTHAILRPEREVLNVFPAITFPQKLTPKTHTKMIDIKKSVQVLAFMRLETAGGLPNEIRILQPRL